MPIWAAGLLTLGFVAALWAGGQIRCGADGIVFGGPGGRCLNGSVGYLPAFGAMVLIGAALAFLRHPAAPALLTAGVVFAASLTFRSIDQAVCADTTFGGTAIGTHFMWHVLNAVVLYLLTRAMILHARARAMP